MIYSCVYFWENTLLKIHSLYTKYTKCLMKIASRYSMMQQQIFSSACWSKRKTGLTTVQREKNISCVTVLRVKTSWPNQHLKNPNCSDLP